MSPNGKDHKATIVRVKIHIIEDSTVVAAASARGVGPLTVPVLKMASAHVKKKVPALAENPRNVFILRGEVLTSVNGNLVPHDEAIKKSMVRLWSELDIIEWECDRPFVIVDLRKAHNGFYVNALAPDDPFHVMPPYKSDISGARHRVVSSAMKTSANNQQYKFRIQVNGEIFDPDVVCGTPPPP
jgi:hypothetical protein